MVRKMLGAPSQHFQKTRLLDSFQTVCRSKVRLAAPATSTRGIRLPLRLAMYARRWRPPVGRPPACCPPCFNSSRRATGVHRRCGHFSPPAPATGELLAARGGVCARRTARCATRHYRRSRCRRCLHHRRRACVCVMVPHRNLQILQS